MSFKPGPLTRRSLVKTVSQLDKDDREPGTIGTAASPVSAHKKDNGNSVPFTCIPEAATQTRLQGPR